jgi:hypothetical protein
MHVIVFPGGLEKVLQFLIKSSYLTAFGYEEDLIQRSKTYILPKNKNN